MKVTPMLFKDEMVRAVVDGRKTQTRRLLKVPDGWSVESPCGNPAVTGMITSKHPKQGKFGVFISRDSSGFTERDIVVCPYGKPGDLIYVREAHIRGHAVGGYQPHVDPDKDPSGPTVDIIYRADDGPNERSAGPWTPSIHMPRWASRLTLKIKSIRVERLQDISEEDAKAEGSHVVTFPLTDEQQSMTDRFRSLWKSINGSDSWNTNPWVWRIQYEPIIQNVDVYLSELEEAA